MSVFINLLNKVPTKKKKKKKKRLNAGRISLLLHRYLVGDKKKKSTLFNWPQWHLESKMCNNINADTMSSFSKCLLFGLIVFSLQLDEWAQLSALWPWHRSSMHPNRLTIHLSPHCCSATLTLWNHTGPDGWRKDYYYYCYIIIIIIIITLFCSYYYSLYI